MCRRTIFTCQACHLITGDRFRPCPAWQTHVVSGAALPWTHEVSLVNLGHPSNPCVRCGHTYLDPEAAVLPAAILPLGPLQISTGASPLPSFLLRAGAILNYELLDFSWPGNPVTRGRIAGCASKVRSPALDTALITLQLGFALVEWLVG